MRRMGPIGAGLEAQAFRLWALKPFDIPPNIDGLAHVIQTNTPKRYLWYVHSGHRKM